MPVENQAKAQALLAQLEQHQQDQIQCLQELFGVSRGDKAKSPVPIEGAKGTPEYSSLKVSQSTIHMPTPHYSWPSGTSEECMTNSGDAGNNPEPSTSPESVSKVKPSRNMFHMPEEWAFPWSNALLRERIEERERAPGCGGGLARRKFHPLSDFI